MNSRQIKAAYQYTMQDSEISLMELMKRSAVGCMEIMEMEGLDLSRPCVVCGSGMNGGSGMVIARMLAERNYPVTVCFPGQELHCIAETRWQLAKLVEMGIWVCNRFEEDEYSIIIDAIVGCQEDEIVPGEYHQTLLKMNRAQGVKLAVDIPSGVSADCGSVSEIAFHADITIMPQSEMLGLMLSPGRESAGKIRVTDIGLNVESVKCDRRAVCVCERCDYQKLLPVRYQDSHKGSYGKLLVIAGSKGMSGAAYLNAKAAYMTGAGLVRIYTSEENRIVLQQQLPEAIVTTYEDYNETEVVSLLKWADAVCIGSGIGMSEISRRILFKVLEHAKIPCLVDADGLNLLAACQRQFERIRNEKLPTGEFVFTPHMKEMSRLIRRGVEEIREHRLEILEEYMDIPGLTCVLKDSRTIIYASGKQPHVNLSGNEAMAKAGSGDVLSGVIAGLMVQGMNGYDAAVLGTWLHGRAGDYARKIKGNYSVLARDLVECLSNAFQELETAGGEE